MSKALIIVESPTKGRTISRFLGKNYDVEASFGHVRDLPKSKVGIDTDNDFTPTYAIPTKAKEVIKKLKEKAEKASEIILATDEDREGEAIAWHLLEALKIQDQDKAGKVKRIVFHEITKPAIEHALLNPRKLDLNLVDAQQARRILDRLVGYELSPFLWKKIRFGLSAGRVQSVAVRLVVEREREIDKFIKEEYWTIEALVSKTDEKIKFITKLFQIGGKSLDKFEVNNQSKAEEIVADIKNANFKVSSVEQKETKRSPSAPFITSTLQQEAARKLGFSAKQTMVLAQQLYEGVDVGEHHSGGLITYMRTDSTNLAASAVEQARSVIDQEFGSNYSLSSPRVFKTKAKGAQEAHEAIRPTNLELTPEMTKPHLERGQQRLYELIWKRTIASQMTDALLNQTTVKILATGKSSTEYGFKSTGQVIIFDGFLKVYSEGTDNPASEEDQTEDESKLPQLEQNENLIEHEINPLQHFTEPPPRFTDASLIKALESHGIGRPSTYAPTLSTIQDREYVTKEDKKYKPTEIGYLVNDMLVEHFPEIVDINFTSQIEAQLDEIAEGEVKWVPVVRDFYTPFKQHLIEKEASVEKQVEVSTVPCPHCGQMMLMKFGRTGKFLACPEPGSKVTKPMPEEEAQINALKEKTQGEKCPICEGPMDVKRGRFGFFLGCHNYPTCKGISKIWDKTGFKCPNCLARHSLGEVEKIGDVVARKSRGRGKAFWGCNKYPDCTFITNTAPESETQLQELFQKWKENPPKAKEVKGEGTRYVARERRTKVKGKGKK